MSPRYGSKHALIARWYRRGAFTSGTWRGGAIRNRDGTKCVFTALLLGACKAAANAVPTCRQICARAPRLMQLRSASRGPGTCTSPTTPSRSCLSHQAAASRCRACCMGDPLGQPSLAPIGAMVLQAAPPPTLTRSHTHRTRGYASTLLRALAVPDSCNQAQVATGHDALRSAPDRPFDDGRCMEPTLSEPQAAEDSTRIAPQGSALRAARLLMPRARHASRAG